MPQNVLVPQLPGAWTDLRTGQPTPAFYRFILSLTTQATGLDGVPGGGITITPGPLGPIISLSEISTGKFLGNLTGADAIPAATDFTFINLTDAPHNYVGDALKLVRVKSDESGLEFVKPTSSEAGFGFEAAGLLAANELLGFASWPSDVTFTATTESYLNAFSTTPATAIAVFRILNQTLVTVGTITVSAGAHSGAVVWTPDPYVHPNNTTLFVYAPSSADATLGNVNALVVGAVA